LCPVRVIDYNHTEKVYDNSIFYRSFVSGLMQTLELPEDCRDTLLVNSNLVMQMLDEKGLSPYKTFESISRFAELLSVSRGSAFSPRITQHQIADHTQVTLIEPPCGSNTAILQNGNETLFIDCGYALYRQEMEAIFRKLLPDWDDMRKRIFITHADVDHCGLLSLFDEIFASEKSKECLTLEYEGMNGFREQNPMHRPYINICKTLTRYVPPEPGKVHALWEMSGKQEAPLTQIGFFRFGEMDFEVYQGKGGHLEGETVLIDFTHHVAFTGDIYVNVHGMTREQAAYNQYAPVLMTSVDTDPELCAEERRAILQRLGVGRWQVFGAHGMKKDYQVQVEK
jgi:glyoxylase-like metal-dependent hydrolase (beta-lactamase superfamily II)